MVLCCFILANQVFSWTTACALEDIKVVIMGQDPYHGPNQAHGIFSHMTRMIVHFL